MFELAEHPQLEARGRWAEVDSPVGALRTLIPPATLDGDEPVMGRIPEPGEHTAAVLAELGISEGAS
jgi:crotonobetainyl-CoA:carnitine CoA-transferase CaiB-like acyl-CoA transferase